MSKVQLYLMRHGETTANRDNILQGHSDFPLTDLGVAQAERCGDTLKDHKWDKVFTSDLNRAHSTAQIVLARGEPSYAYGIDQINQSHLLREINFGVREGLSRTLNKEQALYEVAKRLNINPADVVDTSECNKAVNARQVEFLAHLKEQCAELCKNKSSSSEDGSTAVPKVLCVSHGGFIKEFIKTFCPTVPTPNKIGNCSVTIIHVEWLGEDGCEGFQCTALPEHVNVSVELD